MTQRRGLLLIVVLVLAATPTVPAAAADSAIVRVSANRFDPFEVAVDRGGTVTWLVQEGGHTIVADDRRFVLRGNDGTDLPAGTTVSAPAGAVDEVVGYYCEIHGGPGGQGMSGRIRVGDPPPPPVAETPVIAVPADHPSVGAALAVAGPGHRIEVAPGTYGVAEPIEVGVDDVTIVGTGPAASAATVLASPGQRGFPEVGLRVTGSRVRIENLTVRGFRTSGIHIAGASGVALTNVVVDGTSFSLDGILAEQVNGLTLRQTLTHDARRAGVRVADCAACGLRLDEVASTGNLVGVLLDAASGVLIERARVERNATGLVARTGRTDRPLRPPVVSIRESAIRNNVERGPLATARLEDRPLAVGAGVWLSGATDSRVEGNDVTGNAYGVVLAGDASLRTTVSDNRLAGNADADLAWDGLGAQVCFTGNSGADSGMTSEPTLIEELYPCDRPTVGVAFPLVTARMLLRAAL